jgi:hypothetical protein
MTAAVIRSPRTPLVAPGEMDLLVSDMTATFSGDVTLVAAQARLAEVGQWLPIDGDSQLPLGELMLQNSTGPLRLGYGAWRDLLLGVQFTTGRGELISAGGRTVKNVAGYDLTKFIVGSAGMFGKINTLTVRTYRRPESALLVTFPADIHLIGRLMPTALRPQWATLGSDQMFCGYLGDARTIQYYLSNLPQAEPEAVVQHGIDDDIARRAQLWRAEGEITFRAAMPPMQIAELAADLDCQSWIGDPAFGSVLGWNLTDDRIALLRESAAALGGTIRFLTRNPAGGSPIVDFSTNPVERQIIEKLKLAFDPDGKLIPLPWQTR